MSNLAFGIDLGTTNSAISCVLSGTFPTIIPVGVSGEKIMPSCVMWLGGDEFIVGEFAYEHFEQANVAHSFKRLIGSNEVITLTYEGKSRDFTPVELSSLVLKELCKRVEGEYGKVERVVITVPAYFTNDQVAATREAGELAGLEVLSTFREPVSSALAYAVTHIEKFKFASERYMVYDLGGGTFDVSIVEINKSIDYTPVDKFYGFDKLKTNTDDSAGITLNVKGKYGDMLLGGDDIDEQLVNATLARVKQQGYSVENLTATCLRSIKHKCELFKKMAVQGMKLRIELTYTDGREMQEVSAFISRDDLAEATNVIYQRTQSSEAKRTVRKALGTHKLDGILLIGGSTKNDYIAEALKSDYPNVPLNRRLNPDEAVCLGAGLQANRLINGTSAIKVNDVLPLPIGVLVDGDKVFKILNKDSKVPTLGKYVFGTQEDNQDIARIKVYQGNSSYARNSHFIGELTIDNLPKGKAGEYPITVSLAVNLDGVLNCKATVNGETKTLTLANIFKGTKKEESKKETNTGKYNAMINRWKETANKQARGEEILVAIKEYENGDIDFATLLGRVSSMQNKIERPSK